MDESVVELTKKAQVAVLKLIELCAEGIANEDTYPRAEEVRALAHAYSMLAAGGDTSSTPGEGFER